MNIPRPWKALKKTLDASVPKQAARRWEFVARLETSDGMIMVFDPAYYAPTYSDPDHIYDLRLDGNPGYASIFLERVQLGDNYWRNMSVAVLFSDEPEIKREKVGSIGVDSATLAVASADLLPKRWVVGGEFSDSSIWIEFMDKDKRNVEGRRAAELLAANGFRVKHEDGWLYRFAESLSNADIERADTLLQVAGIPGRVNTVLHHSTELIRQQLAANHVAFLDNRANPYLIAFESGWGDGTYHWFALTSGERTIGFISQMIGADEF